jgi:hypothetical protein
VSLPRYSQDLNSPDFKRKQGILRQIAQVALSFAVTWVILDACYGRDADPVARFLNKATSKVASITFPWHHATSGIVPLRPLSLEAHVIKKKCESLPPFSPNVHRERISRAHTILQELSASPDSSSAGEVYILEPGASSFYYSGIGSQQWHSSERPFLFVISHREHTGDMKEGPLLSILTPAFEAPRAKLLDLPGLDKDTEVEYIEWKEEENWAEVLLRHLEHTTHKTEHKGTPKSLKIHFDPAVRSFIPAGLAHAVIDAGIQTRIVTDVADPRILSVRERKSAEEIAVLKCANEVCYSISLIKRAILTHSLSSSAHATGDQSYQGRNVFRYQGKPDVKPPFPLF